MTRFSWLRTLGDSRKFDDALAQSTLHSNMIHSLDCDYFYFLGNGFRTRRGGWTRACFVLLSCNFQNRDSVFGRFSVRIVVLRVDYGRLYKAVFCCDPDKLLILDSR